MIIDKLLSTINAELDDLVTASMSTLGGADGIWDFGPARNNGLLSNTDLPGWVVTLLGGTSGGASTLSLRLITSAAVNLSSPTVLWSVSGLTLAQTVRNQLFVPVPNTDSWLRYAAFQGQAGTAVFTGGTVSVEFAANKRNWRAYPATQNN